MGRRRIATSVESLGTIVVIDSAMIQAKPPVIRRNYVVQLLRALADSVEAAEIHSFTGVQWDGEASLSGTAVFEETGEETFTFDLT